MKRVVISEYDEQGKASRGLSVNGASAVTPADGTDLPNGSTSGIYVGAAGDVAVVMNNGDSVTFTGLSAGTVHKLSVKRIKATGTTATGIVALY
jgi:hypothetical protein